MDQNIYQQQNSQIQNLKKAPAEVPASEDALDDFILSMLNQAGVKVNNGQDGDGMMMRYLPVKDVQVDVHVQDGVAVITMVHQYYNP